MPSDKIELAQWIVSDPRFDEFMRRFQAGRIAEGLDVINSLGGLDDAWLHRWVLDAVRENNPILETDADLLGRTLSSRALRYAVDDIIAIYRAGRKDVEPALRHCIGLIGFFDRLLLGISPPSSDEKWLMLIELAAELLPNGPDQDALWERAGGRTADLLNHGTGQERWRHAIRAMQSGRSPRAPKLIQQLQVDFPANNKLRLLAADPQFQDQISPRSSSWRW